MSSLLNFSFEEEPVWRNGKHDKTTSQMITEITKRRLEYETSEDAKQFCTDEFARAMAVDYIHNLNVGEMVGTQKLEDTKELLAQLYKDFAGREPSPGCTRSEKETLNTYKAMNIFHSMHDKMKNTGLLTVQEICDIHRELLQEVHENCGNIRTKEAFTQWHGGPFYYPPPERAVDRFYALVDRHNIYMKVAPIDKMSEEHTIYLFKCAARLLFEFVDTHPFSDGNGRMCRLLANYVVGLITPFPVSLYHTEDPARSGRDDYVNAIVRCRDHPQEGPGGLAAMLVEGAWRGWESLFQNLERRHQLQPGIVIGPIVVKKSTCDRKHISERISHSWLRVQERGVDLSKERVIDLIVGATQEAELSSVSRTQLLLQYVTVAEGVRYLLHIFNI